MAQKSLINFCLIDSILRNHLDGVLSSILDGLGFYANFLYCVALAVLLLILHREHNCCFKSICIYLGSNELSSFSQWHPHKDIGKCFTRSTLPLSSADHFHSFRFLSYRGHHSINYSIRKEAAQATAGRRRPVAAMNSCSFLSFAHQDQKA